MSERPYPGLRAFRREEIDIFFGREQQTDDILEKLQAGHFLAVIGPSGCGKSSLVRTGVLSALDSGFMASAGARWVVADMHPGHQPFVFLAEALLSDARFAKRYRQQFPENWGEDWKARAQPFLEASLQRGPLSMHELLDQLDLKEGVSILLLVDQFEEVFRYQRYASNEAGVFVRLLLEASKHPCIYVIITMRSDFLGLCSGFTGLPEAINRGLYLTPRMGRDQMSDAIALPARVFGGSVEPELINRLLNEAGQAMDQLPLLQHLLMRLWDKDEDKFLTLNEYQQMGGLSSILNNHLEEAWGELTPVQQGQAEQMFRMLTERTREGQDVRRPVRLNDLMLLAQVSFDEAAAIIEHFRRSGRYFLMPPAYVPLTEDTVIDITHESLIRQWGRLRRWVENEAENADLYSRLEDTARRYQQGKAALLVSPDLDIALKWREQQTPTEEWARRYGQDFQVVVNFLDASEQERIRQRKAVEDEYQEKVRLRYRRPLMGFAIGFAFFLIAAVVGWGYYIQLVKTLDERDQAQGQVRDVLLRQASVLAQTDDFRLSGQRLDELTGQGQQATPSQLYQARLLRHFIRMRKADPVHAFGDAGVSLHDVVLLPNGRELLAAGEDGVLALYTTANPEQEAVRLAASPHVRHVQDIAVHPGGGYFVTTGDDGLIVAWQLLGDSASTARVVQQYKVPGGVKALAFSADGAYLASGGTDQRVTLWGFQAGSDRPLGEGWLWRGNKQGAQISEGGLAFTPDGMKVVSASHAGTVRFWDVQTGEEDLPRQLPHEGMALSLAFSPDGNRLAVAHGTRVSIWDWRNRQLLGKLDGAHKLMLFSVAWVRGSAPDMPRLVTASMDQELYLWDVENGVTLRKLEGHTAEVGIAGLAYDERNGHLFSPGKDGVVLEWDIAAPYLHTLHMAQDRPQDVGISTDLQWIVTGDGWRSEMATATGERLSGSWLRVYDPNYQPKGKSWLENRQITRVLFQPGGNLLAVATRQEDGDPAARVVLYQVHADGRLERLREWRGHHDAVNDLAFSHDGQWLFSASDDGQTGIFPVGDWQQEAHFLSLHDGRPVSSVAVDVQNRYLLSSSSGTGHAVRFNSLKNGQVTAEAEQELPLSADAYSLRTSPDGHKLLIVGRRASAYTLDLNSKGLPEKDGQKRDLPGHASLVQDAAFIEAGNVLVTSDADSTLHFWRQDQGEQLFALRIPAHNGLPLPFRHFALSCVETRCLLGVPLAQERDVVVYELRADK